MCYVYLFWKMIGVFWVVGEFVYVYWRYFVVDISDFVIGCEEDVIVDEIYQLVFECVFVIVVRLWGVYEF